MSVLLTVLVGLVFLFVNQLELLQVSEDLDKDSLVDFGYLALVQVLVELSEALIVQVVSASYMHHLEPNYY